MGCTPTSRESGGEKLKHTGLSTHRVGGEQMQMDAPFKGRANLPWDSSPLWCKAQTLFISHVFPLSILPTPPLSTYLCLNAAQMALRQMNGDGKRRRGDRKDGEKEGRNGLIENGGGMRKRGGSDGSLKDENEDVKLCRMRGHFWSLIAFFSL